MKHFERCMLHIEGPGRISYEGWHGIRIHVEEHGKTCFHYVDVEPEDIPELIEWLQGVWEEIGKR